MTVMTAIPPPIASAEYTACNRITSCPARGDKAHRRQMADGEGAAVQDLDQQQPAQFGAVGHQAPAQHAAAGGKQQQVARIPAAKQHVAAGENNHLRYHAQRPQIADSRGRIARLLPVNGAEAVVAGMRPCSSVTHSRKRQTGPSFNSAHSERSAPLCVRASPCGMTLGFSNMPSSIANTLKIRL